MQVDFAAHVACSVKHVGRVEKDAEAKVAENSMLGMRGTLHLRVGSFRAQFGVACLLVAPLSSCLLNQTPNLYSHWGVQNTEATLQPQSQRPYLGQDGHRHVYLMFWWVLPITFVSSKTMRRTYGRGMPWEG